MKLSQIYEKPLKEVLDEFDLVKENINTDDTGEVRSIELKYIPKDAPAPKKIPDIHVPVGANRYCGNSGD